LWTVKRQLAVWMVTALSLLQAGCRAAKLDVDLPDPGVDAGLPDCPVGYRLQNAYLGTAFSLQLTRKVDRPFEYTPVVAPSDEFDWATALWDLEPAGSEGAETYRLRNFALDQYLVHSIEIQEGADGEDRVWSLKPVESPYEKGQPLFALLPYPGLGEALGTTTHPPYQLRMLTGDARPDQHWRLSAYRNCAMD